MGLFYFCWLFGISRGLCRKTHELCQKLNQNFHSLLCQRNCVENKWFQKAYAFCRVWDSVPLCTTCTHEPFQKGDKKRLTTQDMKEPFYQHGHFNAPDRTMYRGYGHMRHYTGSVEIVCGSMFSGKTEELIRRIRRAIIAKQHVQVFKPQVDDRYGVEQVMSHNGQSVEALPCEHADEIFDRLDEHTTVIAVDEAQFFDAGIVDVVEQLADRGLRVIVAGLDTDFRGEPFGSMPQLMCRADDVTKLRAICVICGHQASRTQRLVNGEPAPYDDDVIMVGANETYEPRCREHHYVPRKEKVEI
jgi:thymidine kinase